MPRSYGAYLNFACKDIATTGVKSSFLALSNHNSLYGLAKIIILSHRKPDSTSPREHLNCTGHHYIYTRPFRFETDRFFRFFLLFLTYHHLEFTPFPFCLSLSLFLSFLTIQFSRPRTTRYRSLPRNDPLIPRRYFTTFVQRANSRLEP